ncbi:MAG: N-acetylmuramoyl-L-alanine amidase [Campylobacteraceae bacterium]|nr:N-acetylmuramoyl-L-alanine amidase [Campylobacteraceae bacterium]
MARIAKVFFIFFTFVCLNATHISFQKFDNSFDGSSKQVKQSLHNEIKDIYLDATISGNKDNRISALKRLVYSSKALGLNYAGYENELNSLGDSSKNYKLKTVDLDNLKPVSKKEIQQSSSTPKEAKKQETIKKDTKKEEPKVTVVKKESSQEAKKVSQNEQKAKEEPKKQVSYDTKLKLLGVQQTDDGVILNFNRPVMESEIKQFALKGDLYRNVVDFKAENLSKTTRINDHLSKEIRVAQFDKTTSRFVVAKDDKFDIELQSSENSVIVSIKGSYEAPTKTAQKTDSKKAEVKKTDSKKTAQKLEPVPIKTIKKSKIIVLDPGHGGKDPGAVGGGLREKDIVLYIAKKLGDDLKGRGYKVLYTRSADKFINLKSRTAYANKQEADMFISIHVNAGPSTSAGRKLSGIETFFLSPARSERSKNAAALENKGDIEDMNYFSKETYLNFLNREKIIASNKLAIDIQKHMLNQTQKKYSVKDGGVREAPFWVLVGATMPAVLVEVGYISNSSDRKNLAKKEYQNAVAKGIADGIDAYFLKN